MAILNTIRGKSSVLIIVIGMALFSFVFAELIKSGDSFGAEQSVVANVNGIDIVAKNTIFLLIIKTNYFLIIRWGGYNWQMSI